SSSPCRDSFPLTPRLPTPQELLWSAGGVRARLSRVRLLPTAEDRVMRNLALEARRRFLVVSATAGLGSLLRLQADTPPPRSPTADACILLFLNGGMSHLDTFDPKPDQPPEIRGQFRVVRTSAPGILVTEHLPHLARQAHHFAVLRSVGFEGRLGNH